jgi:hypothetical protein
MGVMAQGVKILKRDRPDVVVGVDRIVKEDPDEEAAAVEPTTEIPAEEAGEEAPAGGDAPEAV